MRSRAQVELEQVAAGLGAGRQVARGRARAAQLVQREKSWAQHVQVRLRHKTPSFPTPCQEAGNDASFGIWN